MSGTLNVAPIPLVAPGWVTTLSLVLTLPSFLALRKAWMRARKACAKRASPPLVWADPTLATKMDLSRLHTASTCTSGLLETDSQPPEGSALEEIVSDGDDFQEEVVPLQPSYAAETTTCLAAWSQPAPFERESSPFARRSRSTKRSRPTRRSGSPRFSRCCRRDGSRRTHKKSCRSSPSSSSSSSSCSSSSDSSYSHTPHRRSCGARCRKGVLGQGYSELVKVVGAAVWAELSRLPASAPPPPAEAIPLSTLAPPSLTQAPPRVSPSASPFPSSSRAPPPPPLLPSAPAPAPQALPFQSRPPSGLTRRPLPS